MTCAEDLGDLRQFIVVVDTHQITPKPVSFVKSVFFNISNYDGQDYNFSLKPGSFEINGEISGFTAMTLANGNINVTVNGEYVTIMTG